MDQGRMGFVWDGIRLATLVWVLLMPAVSRAQDVPPPAPAPVDSHASHEVAPPEGPVEQDPHAAHRTQSATAGDSMFTAREASGTAWLPDASPMHALHRQLGGWQLMLHGNAFLQYLHESGSRGSDQAGSINWLMGMARRPLGGGRFGLRSMISLEPLTIRGCGYPDLLATGEQCDGAGIHDRQHPHDLFMELAGEYDRPLADGLRWQVYGGVAGEPALGPTAFPHRLSAMPNPVAPIAHHWLDATHITFGVLTAGVYGARWKAEGSTFNGREPDESRGDLDLGPLDSIAGRVWYLPSPHLALQVSAGHLVEAEANEPGEPPVDVTRLTASATYHRPIGSDRFWASTVAWGRNKETDGATHALLAETALTWRQDAWFGRIEVAGKAAHDLDIHGSDDVFTVTKLQLGYTRYFGAWHGLQPGVGGVMSASIVPGPLVPVYGRRGNVGVGLFLTLRPQEHR